MSRLARENRVLFVESLGLRRRSSPAVTSSASCGVCARGVAPPRRADGLHVLSPLVLPLHGFAARARAQRVGCCRGSSGAPRGGSACVRPILWAYVPQAEALLDALDPSLVVYHCVDDIAAQPGIDGASLPRRRDALRASAPTSCWPARRALAARLRTLNDNVLYAPNVADTAAVRARAGGRPGRRGASTRCPRPRIVFTGAVVATKLDVRAAGRARRDRGRDWSFALVGPVGPGDPRTDVSALAAEPNIHLLGGRGLRRAARRPARRRRRPDPLRRQRAHRAAIFPMKVYEYLAAGLPVVATPLPSLAGVDGGRDAPPTRPRPRGAARRRARPRRPRSAARAALAARPRRTRGTRALEEIAASPIERAYGRPVERTVLVSVHTPILRSGRAVRTYGVARALAAVGPADAALRALRRRRGRTTAFGRSPASRSEVVEPSRGAAAGCSPTRRARLTGVPDDFARGVSPGARRGRGRRARAERRGPRDRRRADRGRRARRARAPAPGHLQRAQPRVRLPPRARRRASAAAAVELRRFERGVLARGSAESWMVSEADVRPPASCAPRAQLRLVPNVVDVAAIEPVFAISEPGPRWHRP